MLKTAPAPHVVLVVDDDEGFRRSVSSVVRKMGWTAIEAGSLAEARTALTAASPQLVLLDLELPDGYGLDLRLSEGVPVHTPFVVLSGDVAGETVRRAMLAGAEDYLSKPVDPQRLETVLRSLALGSSLREEVSDLRAALRRAGRFGRMIGASPAMRTVYDLIERVAPTAAPVLLTGESGTGKEVAALTLHDLSKLRDRAFVAINCGAIPETLVESRLFGHEKGAFTGADRLHVGVFESADGGTLFLDEIGEMPPGLQVRLLRVLESGTFTRVGGTATLKAHVRVIAATNRDPAAAIAAGTLREDLFHRLSVFPIRLPPLRDRPEDVPLLAAHFLEALNAEAGEAKEISREGLRLLSRQSWSGNVRELRNVLQRAYIMAAADIDEAAIQMALSGQDPASARPTMRSDSHAAEARPPNPHPAGPAAHGGTSAQAGERAAAAGEVRIPLPCTWGTAEEAVILAMLAHCKGNKRKAARDLEISVKTLYSRLRDYEGHGGEHAPP